MSDDVMNSTHAKWERVDTASGLTPRLIDSYRRMLDFIAFVTQRTQYRSANTVWDEKKSLPPLVTHFTGRKLTLKILRIVHAPKIDLVELAIVNPSRS